MIKCLEEKNIEYEVDDLYQINFNETFSEEEYLRDADCLIFIYPVFWSEALAKLVGWF